MLDKAPPPRYKTCGGGLVTRARVALDLDLSDVVERECHLVALNLVETGLGFEVRRDSPPVTMTMRAALDARLLDAACQAGATLLAPFEVVSVEGEAHGVRLRSRTGAACTALHVVAADGALSATARAAGWPEQAPGIPALESEIRVDDATLERLRGQARFDFEVVAGGYAWLFPKRHQLSIGVLSTRRGATGLRQSLQGYLRLLGIDRVVAREDHGFVIPTSPREGGPTRGPFLLVGDAAGLADPLTGEGISHAVISGGLAAASIAAGLGDHARVNASYAATLERGILAELRAARVLARLLYDHPRLRRTGFRRLGQPVCEAITRVIAGEATYRELLGSPLNYARLLTAAAAGDRRRSSAAGRHAGPPA